MQYLVCIDRFVFFFGLDGSELTMTEMPPAFLTYGRVGEGDASLRDARSFTGLDACSKDAGNQSACGVHGTGTRR